MIMEYNYLEELYIKDQINKDVSKNNFKTLFKFYKALYTSQNYDIKILVTRRAYDLYKIFEICFESENLEKYGKFYTSNYLSMLSKEELLKKRILIIDDIVINGRTIGNISNQLAEIFDIKSNKSKEAEFKVLKDNYNVHICALLVNKEGKCLESIKQLFINYDRQIKVSESFWREISNELNHFIAVCNLGYTSYVDTIIMGKSSFPVDLLKKYIEKEQKNKLFEKCGLKSYVYFFNKKEINKSSKYSEFVEFCSQMKIRPCIRTYTYNNSTTIIPYAYLPLIPINIFKKYYDFVLLFIKDRFEIEETKIPVLNNVVKDDVYVFIYEWMTFILSKIVGNIFLPEIVKDKKVENKGIKCTETFSKFYIDDVDVKYQNFKKTKRTETIFIKQNFNEVNIYDNSVEDCLNVFTNIFKKNGDSLQSVLKEYLFEIRKIDQKRADQNQERMNGLGIEHILKRCRSNGFNYDDILLCMLNCWDCGDGSGSPKIFGKNEKYICTSIINGEQIYKYVFDLYELVTYDFKFLYFNCYVSKKKLYKYLTKFAEYMDKNKETEEYSKFINRFSEETIDDFIYGITTRNINNNTFSCKTNVNLILNFIKETNCDF